MSKIRYSLGTAEMEEMVEKVINQFPNKFIHINKTDLAILVKDAPKSIWRGRIRLLTPQLRLLSNKKIVMELWKQDWKNSSEAQRAAVVYHELTHVKFSEKKHDYVAKKHDVETFKETIDLFGLNDEKVNEVFGTFSKNPTVPVA